MREGETEVILLTILGIVVVLKRVIQLSLISSNLFRVESLANNGLLEERSSEGDGAEGSGSNLLLVFLLFLLCLLPVP